MPSSYGMATLGRVLIQFVARTDEIDRALAKSEKGISEFAVHIAKLGTSFIALGATSSQIFNAMLRPMQMAINTAREFQTDLNRITTIMESGASAADKYQKGLLRISRTMGIELKDASNALYEAISGGIREENALQVLEKSAQLARIGMTDLNTATKALRTVINAYHIDLSDTSTATQKLNEISSILFNTVDFAAFSFEDLAKHMGKVLPLAKLAGIEFKEITSLMAAMNRNGLDATQAVTGLNNLLISFIKPTDKAKRYAADLNKQLGLSGDAAFELSASYLGKHGLIEALQKLTEVSQGNLDVVGQMITRRFGLQAYGAAVTDSLMNAREAVKQATEGMGDLSAEFDTMRDVTFRMNQTFAQFQSLIEQAGRTQLPMLGRILDVVNGKLEEFNQYLEKHPTFAGGFASAYTAVALVGKGLSSILVQLGFISFALLSLRPVIQGTLITPIKAAVHSFEELIERSATFGELARTVSAVWGANAKRVTNAWTIAFRDINKVGDLFRALLGGTNKDVLAIERSVSLLELAQTSEYRTAIDGAFRFMRANALRLNMLRDELKLLTQMEARERTAVQLYNTVIRGALTTGKSLAGLDAQLGSVFSGRSLAVQEDAFKEFIRAIRASIASIDVTALTAMRDTLMLHGEPRLVAYIDTLISKVDTLKRSVPSWGTLFGLGGDVIGKQTIANVRALSTALQGIRTDNLRIMADYGKDIVDPKGGWAKLPQAMFELRTEIDKLDNVTLAANDRLMQIADTMIATTRPAVTLAEVLGTDATAGINAAAQAAERLFASYGKVGTAITTDTLDAVASLKAELKALSQFEKELASVGSRVGVALGRSFDDATAAVEKLSDSLLDAMKNAERLTTEQATVMRGLRDSVVGISRDIEIPLSRSGALMSALRRSGSTVVAMFKQLGSSVLAFTKALIRDTVVFTVVIEAFEALFKVGYRLYQTFAELAGVDLGYAQLSEDAAGFISALEGTEYQLNQAEIAQLRLMESVARSAEVWKVFVEAVSTVGRQIEHPVQSMKVLFASLFSSIVDGFRVLIDVLSPGRPGTWLLGGLVKYLEDTATQIQNRIQSATDLSETYALAQLQKPIDAYQTALLQLQADSQKAAKELQETLSTIILSPADTVDTFNSALANLKLGEFTEEQLQEIKNLSEQTNRSLLDATGVFYKGLKTNFTEYAQDRERLFAGEVDFVKAKEEAGLAAVRGILSAEVAAVGDANTTIDGMDAALYEGKEGRYAADSESLRQKIAADLNLIDSYYARLQTQEQKISKAITETQDLRERAFVSLLSSRTEDEYNRTLYFIQSLDARLVNLRAAYIEVKAASADAVGDEKTAAAWRQAATMTEDVAAGINSVSDAADDMKVSVQDAAQTATNVLSGIPKNITDDLAGLNENLRVRVALALKDIETDHNGFLDRIGEASETKSEEVARYLATQAEKSGDISAQAIADILEFTLEELKSERTQKRFDDAGTTTGSTFMQSAVDAMLAIISESDDSIRGSFESTIGNAFDKGGILWHKITSFFEEAFQSASDLFGGSFLPDWANKLWNATTLGAPSAYSAYYQAMANAVPPGSFAQGGRSGGGVALVGEEGPELVTLPAGAYVHDADTTKRFIGTFASGGRVPDDVPIEQLLQQASGYPIGASALSGHERITDIYNFLIMRGVMPYSRQFKQLQQYYLRHPNEFEYARREAQRWNAKVYGIYDQSKPPRVIRYAPKSKQYGYNVYDNYGISPDYWETHEAQQGGVGPYANRTGSYGAALNRARGGMSYGARLNRQRQAQKHGQWPTGMGYADIRGGAVRGYVFEISDDGHVVTTQDGQLYQLGNSGTYATAGHAAWYAQQRAIAGDPNRQGAMRRDAQRQMSYIARTFGKQLGFPDDIRRALSGEAIGLPQDDATGGGTAAAGTGSDANLSPEQMAYQQFNQQAQASFKTRYTSAEGVKYDQYGNAMLPDGTVLRNLGSGYFADALGNVMNVPTFYAQEQIASNIPITPGSKRIDKGRGDFSVSTYNGDVKQFIGDPNAMSKHFKDSRSYGKAMRIYKQLESIAGRYGYAPDSLPYGMHRVFDSNGRIDPRQTEVTSKISRMSKGEVMKFDQLMREFLKLIKLAIDEIGGTGEYARRQRESLGGGGRVIRSGRKTPLDAKAEGGRAAGGLTLVGEEGPEIVVLPGGSYVMDAMSTRKATGGRTQATLSMGFGGGAQLRPYQSGGTHSIGHSTFSGFGGAMNTVPISPVRPQPPQRTGMTRGLTAPVRQIPENADMGKIEARIRTAPLSVLKTFVRDIMGTTAAERILSFREWDTASLSDYIVTTLIPQTRYRPQQYYNALQRAETGSGGRAGLGTSGVINPPPGVTSSGSVRSRKSASRATGGSTGILPAPSTPDTSSGGATSSRDTVIARIKALSEPTLRALLGLMLGPEQAASVSAGMSRDELISYIVDDFLSSSTLSNAAIESYISRAQKNINEYPVGTLPPVKKRPSPITQDTALGGVFAGANSAISSAVAPVTGMGTPVGAMAASGVTAASGDISGGGMVQNFNVGAVRNDADIERIAGLARVRAGRLRRARS